MFKRAAAAAWPERFSLEFGWLTHDGKTMARIVGVLAAHAGGHPVFAIIRAASMRIHPASAERDG